MKKHEYDEKNWHSVVTVILENRKSVRKLLTEEEQRIRIQFFGVYIVLFVVSMFMTVMNIITGWKLLMLSTLVFAVMNLVNILLCLISHKTEMLSRPIFGVEMLLLFAFFCISGEPEGFSAIWIALLPGSGLLLFRLKNGTILSLVQFLLLIFLFWTEPGKSLLQYEYTASFLMRFPLLYFAFFMVGVLFEYMRNATQKELVEARQQFEFLSNHDILTGVSNRVGFNNDVDRFFSRGGEGCFALAISDIDNFKNVNDTYGHANGDVVLKTIADIFNKRPDQQKYTISRAENVTLVAQWKLKEYPVNFIPNAPAPHSDSEVSNVPDTQYKQHGIEFNFDGTVPELTGYSFTGWKAANGTQYGDINGHVRIPNNENSEVTLYAQWKPDKYDVIYYSEGTEFTRGIKYHDREYTVIGDEPTREGHTFLGWDTDPKAETVVYEKDDKYSENAPLNLYAVWQKNQYTVQYLSDGADVELPEDVTDYYGESFTVAPAPNREFYTFLYWVDRHGKTYEAGVDQYTITGEDEQFLKAVWDPNKFDITFKVERWPDRVQQVAYNTVPEYDGAPPTKERNYTTVFTFDGWVSEDGTLYPGALPKVSGPATYTAHFASGTRYYQADFHGGADQHTFYSDIDVQFGGTPECPEDLIPTIRGQYFVGWDPELSPVDENTADETDYYAVYDDGSRLLEPKKVYYLNWNGVSLIPDPGYLEAKWAGDIFPLSIRYERPEYEFENDPPNPRPMSVDYTYEFVGWRDLSTGNVIKPEDLPQYVTKDTRYRAEYEPHDRLYRKCPSCRRTEYVYRVCTVLQQWTLGRELGEGSYRLCRCRCNLHPCTWYRIQAHY